MVMESIYLIGFMGAGKTEVGKQLSEKLNIPVIDMDAEIVKQEKQEITEIFAQYGEAYFRTIESNILKAFQGEKAIVTTGGGVILKDENRSFLNTTGRTIFLHCEPEMIAERLQGDTTRPLLVEKSFAEIAEMYKGRLPLYEECANIVVDTTTLTIDQVVNKIVESINE